MLGASQLRSWRTQFSISFETFEFLTFGSLLKSILLVHDLSVCRNPVLEPVYGKLLPPELGWKATKDVAFAAVYE